MFSRRVRVRAPESVSGALAHEQEREAVLRAVRGNAEAFRAIVAQHQAGMYALAVRMIGDRAEAEDVVQDSLFKAHSHLHRFDPRYRLSTWLHRIVLNACRDHLKSARRRERPAGQIHLELAAPDAATQHEVDPLLARDDAQKLANAVGKLQPSYSEIIVLKDLLGFSYLEIHQVTGTPVGCLKIRAVRAREHLRRLLEPSSQPGT